MLTEREIFNARILIVDDEPANVAVLERVLNKGGYDNIRSLDDSREFKRVYEAFTPDLILLDVSMPYVDGFQILEGLQTEEAATPPVLILTAHPDRETRLRLLTAGASDFLTKPFDMLEALLRIRTLLELQLLRRNIAVYEEEIERLRRKAG